MYLHINMLLLKFMNLYLKAQNYTPTPKKHICFATVED